jgi:single-strand DNA-binding protein
MRFRRSAAKEGFRLMMNQVNLIGRLTADPELRVTATSGKSVASFRLAVDRDFTTREGKREADFISCVLWGESAKRFADNCHKGRRVGVTGRLQSRTYETPDGQKRSVLEVVVDRTDWLDEPRGANGHSSAQGDADLPDDIPF